MKTRKYCTVLLVPENCADSGLHTIDVLDQNLFNVCLEHNSEVGAIAALGQVLVLAQVRARQTVANGIGLNEELMSEHTQGRRTIDIIVSWHSLGLVGAHEATGGAIQILITQVPGTFGAVVLRLECFCLWVVDAVSLGATRVVRWQGWVVEAFSLFKVGQDLFVTPTRVIKFVRPSIKVGGWSADVAHTIERAVKTG